jgi:sulfite dehydrogenase (quinone) subunit SoeA
VTGQAAWFDLRVKVTKCEPGETGIWPVFAAAKPLPGDTGHRPRIWRYHA